MNAPGWSLHGCVFRAPCRISKHLKLYDEIESSLVRCTQAETSESLRLFLQTCCLRRSAFARQFSSVVFLQDVDLLNLRLLPPAIA